MKNFKKRKYLSQDVNYLQPNGPQKKFKINGFTYECQSPSNWLEVKIILDATVVDKYLNNRKSNGKISTTSLINARSRRDENDVPFVPQANRMFNNILSRRKDAMVKLEIPEDFQYDTSIQKENDEFINVLVKQENNTINHSAQEDYFEFVNVPVELENNANNSDEFEDPIYNDFQYQNDRNFSTFTETVVDGVFKNKETDIFHEELTIGLEFKHEEFIPISENAELVSQECNNEREEISPRGMRRSKRQKKKSKDLDSNYDYEVAKKPRLSSRVKKKSTIDSNCRNKSKKKKLSKPNSLQSPDTSDPQKYRKSPYCCNYCDSKFYWKLLLKKHIINEHLLPPRKCTECNKTFKRSQNFERHKCLPSHLALVKCKYCPVPFKSKIQMRKHLETKHTDVFPGKIKHSCLDELWIQSMKDVLAELECKGNTKELVNFTTKFLELEKYWPKKKRFFKLYCANCSIIYETNISSCRSCNSIKLLYQCQRCRTTRSDYGAMCKHLDDEKSRCRTLETSPSDVDEDLLNTTDEAPNNDGPCQTYYNCEICGYKWTTKSQLYQHIFKHMDEQNKYFTCSKCHREFRSRWGESPTKWHEEFCGIYVYYPCIFCSKEGKNLTDLKRHILTHSDDGVDGLDIEYVIKYVTIFRQMIKAYNITRFNEKMSKKQAASKIMKNSNFYLNGIQNILKAVCLKCNAATKYPYNICLACNYPLIYQCWQCGKRFSKYFTAWKHVTNTCKNRILTLPIIKTNDTRPLDVSLPSYILDHSYAVKRSSNVEEVDEYVIVD